MRYAGIGSRKTPLDVQRYMTAYARYMQGLGWCLRSGHALGADAAFEFGATVKEIFTTDDHIPAGAFDWAEAFHPAWHRCSPYARRLHARNTLILLGADLVSPVEFVACWTPGGEGTGGTGQAIRIAQFLAIPVYDLGRGDVFP